jgi:hypothetical protein
VIRATAVGATLAVLCAQALAAQGPTMPSTLRYGSGLMDVPVASVLPHLTTTGTLSGFFMRLGRRALVDDTGATTSYGPRVREFYSDGSVAIGLRDRFEVGASLQALGDATTGGDVWGLFGRVRLWQPVDEGLGLAMGGRWLTSPTFGDGREYAPGRLGFADERLRRAYAGVRGVDTDLTLYGVATAFVRGFDGGPLPANDLTFTVGYGGGMFASGGELDFYAPGNANGWFGGSSLHVGTSDASMLTLMVEHNGFDVNVGAQWDWDGLRVGAQYLASNHVWPTDGHSSEYQKPKFGILGSVAVCPTRRGLRCRPSAMTRIEPDTVWIPPPPPDTVIVRVAASPAEVGGVEASLCLSTGQSIRIRATADGDTLVAPAWVSLRTARPNLVLAGAYAAGTFWYESGAIVGFEGQQFSKSVDIFPLDCDQILRVGVHEGVSIFTVVSAVRPLDVLFVPVRPGVWHRYEGARRGPA